jgi:hypothetical protein
VRGQVLERLLALAAVALLAMLVSLALVRDDDDAGGEPASPPPTVAETWTEAPAGPVADDRYGGTTTCGAELTRDLRGVVHPVLPCGARIVVAFGGREAETEVVDQGPVGAGEEFSLTAPLAAELGVDGLQTVRWRFSTGPR